MKNLTLSALASALSFVALAAPVSSAQAGTFVLKTSTTAPRVDEKVWRDYGDDQGNVVRVTFAPREGTRLDMRILDQTDFQILGGADKVELMNRLEHAGQAKRSAPAGETLDASGLVITMDLITATSCSVSATYSTSTLSLSAYATATIQTASGAELISGTVYPTSGDVDVYTYYGSSQCGYSVKGPGYVDVHACYSSTCSNTSTLYSKAYNPNSSTSKYVATSTVMWVN